MSAPNLVKLEQDILRTWKAEDVFAKTLAKPAPRGNFVFFEGPPTANGLPHIGHVETRAFKDLIPRFRTMQGYRVERKAGWDTQGLPVEIEVEKSIGVSGKRDIEAYGIERFNAACRQSVWKYQELWEQMTERVGFWLDLKHPYVTYDPGYIETLWWILKQAWDKQLLVQDYKVVPFCVRCGTALSSHEVAQGYQRVRDRSVYLKFELVDEPGTFILAWTTTPWTLPGNVALAVKPDMRYVKTAPNERGERYIVAVKCMDSLKHTDVTAGISEGSRAPSGQESLEGSKLIGKRYKPLFDFLNLREAAPTTPARRATPPRSPLPRGGGETYEHAYTIVPADFVTTDEGTGVVHTAVMYGEDDFELGKKLDLPKRHTVNEDGTFNELVKPWQGRYVKDPATEQAIVDWLKQHGKLYQEKEYEHDYPFCWRCKSPLLYYAKTSWFLLMSKLRDRLIANNRQINWVPGHIQEGRFGEWLREVKDWAISRERYWGTPLPIWQCDNCRHTECLGGYAELMQKVRPRNRFIFVRHGEATNSNPMTANTDPKNNHVSLTEKGREQAGQAAKRLADEKVEAVYASEFLRTQQTAEPIAKALGLSVTVDPRLNEYRIGPAWEGKLWSEFHRAIGGVAKTADERQEWLEDRFHFHHHELESENWTDIRTRVMSFLSQLDQQAQGKTFVIVSHADPIYVTSWALSLKPEAQIGQMHYPELGEVLELTVPSGLLRPDGSFDPHRPFIDGVTWTCEHCAPTTPASGHPSSGRPGVMRRVPEVADAWFDSGAMPFAQSHYPFEQPDRIKQGTAYPAQFISEAIDQTRGWFYTLLAVASLLQETGAVPDGPPYQTCVVLGHIRDREGKKLSKSLGNYIDPMRLLDRYGADAVRLYLFSVNQPSEPKNFDEGQLAEVVKQTLMILWNVQSFWRLQAQGPAPVERPQAEHVMDRWILARLGQLERLVTEHLERYAVTEAARELTGFVTDLSTWYVRRSRERAKAAGRVDVAATLGYTLRQFAKVAGPFVPFLADALWREIGGEGSVHLQDWPRPEDRHDELLTNMARARQVVETGHALRAQAKLKLRQPLSQLVVTRDFHDSMLEILRDEINVKEIVRAHSLPSGPDWVSAGGAAIDTTLTDELREEGYLREMVRTINALRKELKLKPGERVAFVYLADQQSAKYVQHFRTALMEKGSLASLEPAAGVGEPNATVEVDGRAVRFGRG